MDTRFSPPSSKEDFSGLVRDIESVPGYVRPVAFALGIATIENDEVIAVTYTITNYESSYGTAAVLAAALSVENSGLQTGGYLLTPRQVKDALSLFAPFIGEPGHGNIATLTHINSLAQGEVWRQTLPPSGVRVNERVPILGVIQAWDDKPSTCADAYLRLYTVSEGAKKRADSHVAAAEKLLPVVVESDQLGVFTIDEWNTRKGQFVYLGASTALRGVYKIPRMIDHVVSEKAYKSDPDQLKLGTSIK